MISCPARIFARHGSAGVNVASPARVSSIAKQRGESEALSSSSTSASRNVALWNARYHIVSRPEGWRLPRRRPCRHTLNRSSTFLGVKSPLQNGMRGFCKTASLPSTFFSPSFAFSSACVTASHRACRSRTTQQTRFSNDNAKNTLSTPRQKVSSEKISS